MSDTEDAMIEIPNKERLVTCIDGETSERSVLNLSASLKKFTDSLYLNCRFCKGDKDLLRVVEDEFGIAKRIYVGIHEGVIEVETYANNDSVNGEIVINYCPMCGRKT